MKRRVFLTAILGGVLVLGLTMIGCKTDTDNPGSTYALDGIWTDASNLGLQFVGGQVKTDGAPVAGQRNWQVYGNYVVTLTSGTTINFQVTPIAGGTPETYTATFSASNTMTVARTSATGALTNGTFSKQQ